MRKDWFEKEIEAQDTSFLTPAQPKSIGFLKIAFVWAFFYLKNEWKYKDALTNILL